nr:MAG TPA: hypothetical protein [Caudoviricetes sp.]
MSAHRPVVRPARSNGAATALPFLYIFVTNELFLCFFPLLC